MNDVRIRKAIASDHKAALDLKTGASTTLLTKLGHSLAEIADWHRMHATAEYVKQRMRAPHALFVLEEFDGDEGSIVAMAGFTIRNDGDSAYAYFGNSYCQRSGLGHGSRLMEYRLGVVENFNVDHIECHVHSGNDRARRFVEHYGFEEFGTRRDINLGCVNIIYRKETAL
jgi:RimJ/RimL family protein N-acetyltransferase